VGARRVAGLALASLALLLLAAHFYRAMLYPLAAVAFLSIALLYVSNPRALRVVRAALALGALEWLRTAWMLASHRAALGLPYTRLLVILGAAAAVTLLAAWLVRGPSAATDNGPAQG
jgi:hypothetical protein